MPIDRKRVRKAVASIGKKGIDLAGKAIIGGVKVLNKGLAATDALAQKERDLAAKKRAAKRAAEAARKAKVMKEGGKLNRFLNVERR